MKLNIQLSDYCDAAQIREGQQILKDGSMIRSKEILQENGRYTLCGSVVDSFVFVDHAQLSVNAAGTVIIDYSCDCPDYRRNGNFCCHCAAVALKYGAQDQDAVKTTASEAKPADIERLSIPEVEREVPAQQPETDERTVQDFSYRFANSRRDLYPGVYRPRIPLERFYQVFGHNPRAEQYYAYEGDWGGSCFGISSSATVLFVKDSGLDLSDFNSNALYPSALQLTDHCASLNMSLHTYIEAAHILQYGNDIGYPRAMNEYQHDCLHQMCMAVEAFQRTGEDPVCMAVWDAGGVGGHSVLPFRLERTGGQEDILHIYDPNYPMEVRYAYVEKNAYGEYENWRFPMSSNDVYSSKTGGELSYDRYEDYKNAWDNRFGAAPSLVMTAKPGLQVLSPEGEVLASVTEAGVESNRADIYAVRVVRGKTASRERLVNLPVGQYTLRNDSDDELVVTLSHQAQSLKISTNASAVDVLVDDDAQVQYAAIGEGEKEYAIELKSTVEGAWAQAKLEGITGENGVRFAQHQGTLLCGNLTEEDEILLTVNGQVEDRQILNADIDRIFVQEQVQEEIPEYITCSPKKEEDDDKEGRAMPV